MAVFGSEWWSLPCSGPLLGGWLTDQYSWRWAFISSIFPWGILAVFMIWRFVKDPPYIPAARGVGKFDSIGLGLLAIWLGAMQLILDKGQEDDWFGSYSDSVGLCDFRRGDSLYFLLFN